MPGQVSGGELQTLVSTLQNGNVQLGNIYQALQALTPALSGGLGASVAASGPLPIEPDGFVTVNIPGVGSRLIPYYPTG